MPITDNFKEYAKQVADKLEEKDIRVEFDDRNEKIGYKIREAQLKKVPYMLIIGEKEQDSNSVGVRSREKGDIGAMKIEEFIEKILKEVQNHEK